MSDRNGGGPLEGIRVVDLTHHLGGPLATMALAQLGADVVKVEPPDGDGWRHVDDVEGESRLFHAVNRGKRSVVIDLRTDEGREALHALVRDADVVTHSFSPGVAERIGAGPDELLAINPRLVHCSLSAFGPDGPRGTDIALQAESGMIAGNDGRPLPIPVHDMIAPWIMVAGILAALLERERSGRGQVVGTSLLEASAALSAHRLIREGSGQPLFNRFVGALYRPYETSDGAIALACYAPRLHEAALRAIGLGDLLEDPRFADRAGRAQHPGELSELIGARMRERTTAEWAATLREAGLPHGVVNPAPHSLLEHPAAAAIGLVAEVDDPTLGREVVSGPPLRFSRTPAHPGGPAPRLGEHTGEVLP